MPSFTIKWLFSQFKDKLVSSHRFNIFSKWDRHVGKSPKDRKSIIILPLFFSIISVRRFAIIHLWNVPGASIASPKGMRRRRKFRHGPSKGNLSSPSKNAYSRWGGSSLSSTSRGGWWFTVFQPLLLDEDVPSGSLYVAINYQMKLDHLLRAKKQTVFFNIKENHCPKDCDILKFGPDMNVMAFLANHEGLFPCAFHHFSYGNGIDTLGIGVTTGTTTGATLGSGFGLRAVILKLTEVLPGELPGTGSRKCISKYKFSKDMRNTRRSEFDLRPSEVDTRISLAVEIGRSRPGTAIYPPLGYCMRTVAV
ncbi:hypothetical protein Tco_0087937 [Tanacetum coccineum]